MANGNDTGDGNGEDTGSKDRVTVALVGAKVDEVKAIIAGHAEVTQVKLAAINEKVAPLADIPARVRGLEEKSEGHEHRIDNLEQTRKGDHEFKRERLPTIVISALLALAAIIGALTQIVH